METYKKPYIEVIELQREDAILTSCSSDTGGHGGSGDANADSSGGFPGLPGSC